MVSTIVGTFTVSDKLIMHSRLYRLVWNMAMTSTEINRLFMYSSVRLVKEIMLMLTDSSDWWKVEEGVHSITQSDHINPLAPGVSVDVIIHGAGQEVNLPAGRAGGEVGHSNTAVEAAGAGHGPGTLIASVTLVDVQPRT